MNFVGHQKQWEFLKKKFESNQLSHAYLFVGPEEIGKRKVAFDFVKMINCEGDDEKGECRNCKLIESEKHPDVLMVGIKEDKSEIEISQIREIQQFLNLKPYYSLFKTIIINEAEKMNQEAQSCFLKTLEEPKGKTIFILISSFPDIILPTILSRCQVLKFFFVESPKIKEFLLKKGANPEEAQFLSLVSEGRPGRAIKLFLNKEMLKEEGEILKEILKICNNNLALRFKYIKDLPDEKINIFLSVFRRYLRDLLFLKLGIDNQRFKKNNREVVDIFKKMPILKLKKIIKLLEEISFYISATNINPKLALEILLLDL